MNMRTSLIAAMFFAVMITSGCVSTPADQSTPTSVPTDDRLITSTIKARHAESDAITSTNISVETLYGVVLLSGVAKSPEEKLAATHIAEQVDGVKAVHNEILIQTDHPGQNTARSYP